MKPLSQWRSALFAAGLVLLGVAVPTPAADTQSGDKALDQYLYSSLRHVINHGVDLYNAGRVDDAYEHFRQSLQDLVPVLSGHPELQKTVKDSLDKVEKDPDWRVKMAARMTLPDPQAAPVNRQKAFALRGVFNDVRTGLLGAGGKPAVTPAADEGTIDGKVRLDGKPLATGKVTLSRTGGKPVTADVAADGSFKMTKVPTGTYRVVITGTGVPANYGSATTTPLTTNVTKGSNLLDLDLTGEKKPAADTGAVEGTVLLDGATVARAKVTFHDKDGKAVKSVESDAQGKFKAENLPAGTYQMTVTGTGIPANYGDPKTSGTALSMKVDKGTAVTFLGLRSGTKPAPKPEGESVSGKVTIDGKPLAKGTVTFFDPNGNKYVADVKDGAYQLKLPSELYTVIVGGAGVPAKFGDARTSGLDNHVMKGANAYDIKLAGETKPAPKPEGKPEQPKAPKVPEAIAVPEDQIFLGKLHAEGVQIYEAKAKAGGGFEWAPKEPKADLSDDTKKVIGKHYGSKDGPVWEIEGDKVTGEMPPKKADATAGNIPWLLIKVKEFKPKEQTPFAVTYVQRIDTEGGVAPAKAPEKAEETAEVKYKANYAIYAAPKKGPEKP